MMFSLTAALACTVDKSGDEETGTTDAGASSTGSAGNSETGDATAGSTGAATAEPTTGAPTSVTDPTGAEETSAGETGNGEGNPQCIDTPTVLALDESSAGGFSGEQVLAGKLGARVTTLTIADEPTTLQDSWKSKQMPLTVELRHEGGEVRWIDSEPNPDWDDSGNDSGFFECTDRLEIDVKLDFVTEGKEFDEHRDALLTATAVDTAQVQVQLMPPGVMGSLDPSTLYKPSDPPTTVTGMWVFGTWQGMQAGGTVMHEIRVGEGDEGFAGFGSLGGWGDEIQP